MIPQPSANYVEIGTGVEVLENRIPRNPDWMDRVRCVLAIQGTWAIWITRIIVYWLFQRVYFCFGVGNRYNAHHPASGVAQQETARGYVEICASYLHS